jgi:hypothetical protein
MRADENASAYKDVGWCLCGFQPAFFKQANATAGNADELFRSL